MQFLRNQKFVMNAAFENYENYFLAQKQFNGLFEFSNDQIVDMNEFRGCGIVHPLFNRSINGQAIVLVRLKKNDLKKYTVADLVRLSAVMCGMLMEYEEVQVHGLNIVVDCTGLTLKHIPTPLQLFDLSNFIKSAAPLRWETVYFINMPSLVNAALEMFMSLLGEEFKQSFAFVKDSTELQKIIKNEQLPAELGGIASKSEMMEGFEKIWNENYGKFLETLDRNIDWSKAKLNKFQSNAGRETVGSFRKLDLD